MKIKNLIKNMFTYIPPYNYEFSLPDSSESTSTQNSTEEADENKNVFTSLDVNLDYIKTKYNLLINSDIITR